MNKLLLCGLVFIVAFYGVAPAVSPNATNTIITFIVFGDTHIGRGLGADGWNSTQRLQQLLLHAGSARPIAIMGDLTEGPQWYDRYFGLMAGYRYDDLKGNHDVNATLFVEKLGALNWAVRWKNVLFVAVSSLNEDFASWIDGGITYNRTTYEFLNTVIASQDYAQTKYHFIFMHYAPTSTWRLDAEHGVAARFSEYLQYFTVAFHGHEGGPEWVKAWYGTVVVKTAHLGSGQTSTDTYLPVTFDTTSGLLTVTSHNFATDFSYVLVQKTLEAAT